MKKEGRWFVYVLLCEGPSLYTGITNDLAARVAKHVAKKGARYTRARLPVGLLAKTTIGDKGGALSVERAFKRLGRREKLAILGRPRGLAAFARRVLAARGTR
jgi:putative endonuclease